MKKRIVAFTFLLFFLTCILTVVASASDSDFTIENGVLKKYHGSGGDVVIPDSVTSIGYEAFQYSDLTSVIIPDSVTSIGDNAFTYCDSLMSVTIGNSVTSIGAWAFCLCENLASITIHGKVISIGDGAFSACSSLTRITIPDSVTSIGAHAFSDCSSLTSIIIPDSVTSPIGRETFNRCTNLMNITIGDSVPSIGSYAFCLCENLTKVTIPDSVALIESFAFYHCFNLKNVAIGNSVTSIGTWAFKSCCNLTSLIMPDSITSMGYWVFEECDNLTDVYYHGTEEQWDAISGIENSNLISDTITIHYRASGQENDRPVLEIDTAPYYATTVKRLFRITPLGDSSFRKPAGFIVSANGETFSSGKEICTSTDDVTANIPSDYSGDVRITKSGFHDCALPISLVGQTNRIGMTPVTVTAPFAQAFFMDYSKGSYARFHNLLLEGGSVYELDVSGTEKPETSRLCPIINWNGHGAGRVWLEQGDKKVALTDNAFNEVCLPNEFTANRAVYLCVEATDGTSFRQSTKLTVEKRVNGGMGINLGQPLEVDISSSEQDELGFFMGKSLKIDFSSLSDGLIPINFTIKEGGVVEGTLGLTIADGSYKESAFGQIKEMFARMRDLNQSESLHGVSEYLSSLKKQGIKPAYSHSSWGVSGDAQVIGYFTGNLHDGRIGFTEIKAALIFEGSFSYTWNTFVPVLEIPAYIKTSLKTSIETSLSTSYNEALKMMECDEDQALEGSLTVSGEAGPGWDGYASVGVNAGISVNLHSQLPVKTEVTSMGISGSLSIVGSLAGVRGTWKLFPNGKSDFLEERIFWDAGVFCWKEKEGSVASLQTVFEPDFTVSLMSMSGVGNAIVDGVSGYNAPYLAELTDGRLLAVWTADVAGRSVVDKGGVYFSVCDHDVWSTPVLVNDDGTNDSVPQVHCENGVISVAWKNYQTVFNRDTLPDYQTVSEQIVTVSSIFDENANAWSAPVTGSPNWYLAETELPSDYDGEWPATASVRQFLQSGSMRAVLYTTEDSGAIEQVYGLFNNGDGWGEPVQLTSASANINGFSAIFHEEKLAVLYTTGEYANSSMVLHEASLDADLTVNSADYVRQTLTPGNPLTISAMVKNNSPITINGLHVSVKDGENEVHQEDVPVNLKSGEEDLIYVNYTLPDTIDFTQLEVIVTPSAVKDADESDNSSVCNLYLTDLSVENVSAILVDGKAQILTQVVNRGQTKTAQTTLTFHKDAPDGEEIGRETVSAIEPGDLSDVIVSLSGLSTGDMVYANLASLQDENLLGNNSSQTIVQEEESLLHIGATANYDEGNLSFSIDVDNNSQNRLESLQVIVATYDMDSGKQINIRVLEPLTLEPFDGTSQTIQIPSGQADNSIRWKIFALDDKWMPLRSVVSGTITR